MLCKCKIIVHLMQYALSSTSNIEVSTGSEKVNLPKDLYIFLLPVR